MNQLTMMGDGCDAENLSCLDFQLAVAARMYVSAYNGTFNGLEMSFLRTFLGARTTAGEVRPVRASYNLVAARRRR
jgi:hypothetical protein